MNQEAFLIASQLRLSVRQDGSVTGRRGGRGDMVVKMREGDHKHRQAGRQAGRHVTGHLHHYVMYFVTQYLSTPLEPGTRT